jgi:pentose-5-phosphate-3-epimerase
MYFLLQRRIKNFFINNIQFRVQSEQSVSYDSNISLDGGVDNNENNFLKKIQLNWIVNSSDFEKIKVSLQSV